MMRYHVNSDEIAYAPPTNPTWVAPRLVLLTSAQDAQGPIFGGKTLDFIHTTGYTDGWIS
jgi:hypothetical protein